MEQELFDLACEIADHLSGWEVGDAAGGCVYLVQPEVDAYIRLLADGSLYSWSVQTGKVTVQGVLPDGQGYYAKEKSKTRRKNK